MSKFIITVLVESVSVFIMIYAWQIVKYTITYTVDPTLLDLILSGILGIIISKYLLKHID